MLNSTDCDIIVCMFAFRNDCFTLISANGSLMEAEGPLLTSPVQGLHSYSGPSNGASTSSANAGGSACILNRDYGTDSAEPMDNSLLALEHAQQVKETYAIVNITRRKKEEQEQLARKIERKEREIREKREQKGREQEEASRWPQQQEAFMVGKCCSSRETSGKFGRPFI